MPYRTPCATLRPRDSFYPGAVPTLSKWKASFLLFFSKQPCGVLPEDWLKHKFYDRTIVLQTAEFPTTRTMPISYRPSLSICEMPAPHPNFSRQNQNSSPRLPRYKSPSTQSYLTEYLKCTRHWGYQGRQLFWLPNFSGDPFRLCTRN